MTEPNRDHLPDIQKYFGPSWSWSEIALWIEARSRAKPPLPDYMKVWAYDFLRIWKQQQAMMKEEMPKKRRILRAWEKRLAERK